MPGTPKSLKNTFIITKTICVLLCFQSFLCAKQFFLTRVIFIQGAFKNIQGLLWKIQGLLKDIPQFFSFQRLFKDTDAFSRPLRTMWKIGSYEQSKNMLKTPLLSQTWIPVKMASKTCMSGSILFKFVGTLGCFN